jgi:hypothetical protein
MFVALLLLSDRHLVSTLVNQEEFMIRPRGKKRTLSKKVSSFNMYMDQMFQIRAIMEATDEQKDAPVIRQLLDEALGARRRNALGIADWEEPPGQDDKETFNTISVLLLKLLKHEEKSFMARDVGLLMLRELLIETRACRDLVYEENVRKPWMEKGKTRETMDNFYDMHTRTATQKVEGVIQEIKKKALERTRRFEQEEVDPIG